MFSAGEFLADQCNGEEHVAGIFFPWNLCFQKSVVEFTKTDRFYQSRGGISL
jgi:hypothetical protein